MQSHYLDEKWLRLRRARVWSRNPSTLKAIRKGQRPVLAKSGHSEEEAWDVVFVLSNGSSLLRALKRCWHIT